MRFKDRTEAGRVLAARLAGKYAGRPDVIVLGLPRGGVPVAFEVADALSTPLDVFMVHKLGVPGQEELAMGAIATGGVRILDQETIYWSNVDPDVIEAVTARELAELERRERLYRDDRPPPQLTNQTVILVDDGLSLDEMRVYLRMRESGDGTAAEKKAMFMPHVKKLADDIRQLEIRRRYLSGKVVYWDARLN